MKSPCRSPLKLAPVRHLDRESSKSSICSAKDEWAAISPDDDEFFATECSFDDSNDSFDRAGKQFLPKSLQEKNAQSEAEESDDADPFAVISESKDRMIRRDSISSHCSKTRRSSRSSSTSRSRSNSRSSRTRHQSEQQGSSTTADNSDVWPSRLVKRNDSLDAEDFFLDMLGADIYGKEEKGMQQTTEVTKKDRSKLKKVPSDKRLKKRSGSNSNLGTESSHSKSRGSSSRHNNKSSPASTTSDTKKSSSSSNKPPKEESSSKTSSSSASSGLSKTLSPKPRKSSSHRATSLSKKLSHNSINSRTSQQTAITQDLSESSSVHSLHVEDESLVQDMEKTHSSRSHRTTSRSTTTSKPSSSEHSTRTTTTTTTEGDKDKKKSSSSSSDKKKATKLSEEERRKLAYQWYMRLAMPRRRRLKEQIKGMQPHCDIKVKDIDLLPWNEEGKRVDMSRL